jgi:protein-tyrosine phosphatase
MNLIYKHNPTGGKLYQCGAREIPRTLDTKDIDLLILAAREHQPGHYPVDVMHLPLDDTALMSGKKLKKTTNQAKKAANEGIKRILRGENVLSTCWAGLNRSGLVSGLIIKKLANCSGPTAVKQIRKNRSKFALFNPLFVKIIHRTH